MIEKRLSLAQASVESAQALLARRPAWWPQLQDERLRLARALRDVYELQLVQAGVMIYEDTQQALAAANWRMPEWGTRGT